MPCHAMFVAFEDEGTSVASLTDSDEEEKTLVTQTKPIATSSTWTEKEYLKNYLDATDGSPKPSAKPTAALQQPLDKARHKELRYNKALKGSSKSSNVPF